MDLVTAPVLLPGPRLRVVILSTGPGESVRVDVAIMPLFSAAPAPGSRLWINAGSGETGGAVVSRPLIPGTRVFLRASVRGESGKRLGAYTTPFSIRLPQTPQISDASLHVDQGGVVVQWTPRGATEEVEVRAGMAPEGGAVELGTAAVLAAVPGAHAPALRPPIGYRVEVDVTPRDGGQLLTMEGEEVVTISGEGVKRMQPTEGAPLRLREVRPLDIGTAAAPRHWLFTTEGHPVRDTDFCVVTAGGLGVPDDWILTTGGLPVRSNDLDILRRAT